MSARVRFTIRPTEQPEDSLTICQARTVLYGWLYARHEGGTFVLRAATPHALETLCQELRWLGIDWDEGPLLKTVADDHKLGLPHVLCDARALSHTEQEGAPYDAWGGEPPQIIHLPALVFPGGPGQDQATLAVYRARGYLSLAVANHLARLGWTPRGKRELFSLPELAARFDLRRVSRAPARFDLQQLNWFNRRALCALDAREITALLVPRWEGAFGAAHCAAGTALTPVEWQQALALALREELDALDQVVERARFAFVDEVALDERAREILSQPYASEVLKAFVRELPAADPFVYQQIDTWITALRQRFKAALGAAQGVRSRDVMYVVRAALTGRMDGPCLVEVCQLLGRQRCTERALAAIRYCHLGPIVI